MISFQWKILEVFALDGKINKVHYFISAKDDQNTVEAEGYHQFSEGVVYKSYEETKEEDLVRWLDKDTIQDDVNIIKSNLEKQLEALKNSTKVELPWEIDTFTVE